jgi:hypothetical protein
VEGSGTAMLEGEEVAYIRWEVAEGEETDGDGPHAFARRVLVDAGKGTVYKLQWPSAGMMGSGHIQASRRVVVWRSAAGEWRVVGTCEGDGSSGGQGRWSSSEVTCAVQWAAAEPVVAWKRRETFGLISREDMPDFPDLEVETSGASGGAGGAEAVWEKPRLVIHAGETVETLVERLALESETWSAVEDAAWKREAERLWREALLRANPGLKEGAVAREAVVMMPRGEEEFAGMMRWIEARRKAKE